MCSPRCSFKSSKPIAPLLNPTRHWQPKQSATMWSLRRLSLQSCNAFTEQFHCHGMLHVGRGVCHGLELDNYGKSLKIGAIHGSAYVIPVTQNLAWKAGHHELAIYRWFFILLTTVRSQKESKREQIEIVFDKRLNGGNLFLLLVPFSPSSKSEEFYPCPKKRFEWKLIFTLIRLVCSPFGWVLGTKKKPPNHAR